MFRLDQSDTKALVHIKTYTNGQRRSLSTDYTLLLKAGHLTEKDSRYSIRVHLQFNDSSKIASIEVPPGNEIKMSAALRASNV